VQIDLDDEGRWVVTSDDPLALDRLEEMIEHMLPRQRQPRRDYKVFKMKYASTWAWGVAQNLKDFFDDKEKQQQSRLFRPWWASSQEQSERRRLSKRKPLKFIPDSDSNSIIVTGADPQQLAIIEELIALYDVPESSDSKSVRKTEIFRLRYSKARVIGDALKEVYRDLLSANDPALANQNNQGNQQQQQRRPEATFTYIYNSGDGSQERPETPVKFKGLLSIGVDEVSNTLVVSSAEALMESIAETIRALDEAARPTVSGLRVVGVVRSIDAGAVSQKISKLAPKPPPPQQQPQQPQPGQPQQPQPQPHPTTVEIIND